MRAFVGISNLSSRQVSAVRSHFAPATCYEVRPLSAHRGVFAVLAARGRQRRPCDNGREIRVVCSVDHWPLRRWRSPERLGTVRRRWRGDSCWASRRRGRAGRSAWRSSA